MVFIASGLGSNRSVCRDRCDWSSKRERCSDWSVVVLLLLSIRLVVCLSVSFEVMYGAGSCWFLF